MMTHALFSAHWLALAGLCVFALATAAACSGEPTSPEQGLDAPAQPAVSAPRTENDASAASNREDDQDASDEEHNVDELRSQLQAARERFPFVWIGLTLEEAQAHAQEEERAFRVVRVDGEPQPGARDRQAGRIDADIQDGVVIAVREDQGEGEPLLLIEGVSAPDLLPFIGMSEKESQAAAEAADRPWRVHTRDGEGQMLTMDYLEDRVNVTIIDDQVVGATSG